MASAEWTQAQVNRAVAKLQAFLDKLPEDEQQILGAILCQAADGAKNAEVSGYALPPLIGEFTVFDPTQAPMGEPLGEQALLRRQVSVALLRRR
jgi:hypothetical protein